MSKDKVATKGEKKTSRAHRRMASPSNGKQKSTSQERREKTITGSKIYELKTVASAITSSATQYTLCATQLKIVKLPNMVSFHRITSSRVGILWLRLFYKPLFFVFACHLAPVPSEHGTKKNGWKRDTEIKCKRKPNGRHVWIHAVNQWKC